MTDWERVRGMTDEEIDTSDIPELDEDFFANARLVVPSDKTLTLLGIDEDLAEWLRKQGPDYRSVINTALREYVNAHG